MFVKLRSLNESLEEKYSLNEVFGSMPKWLSDRINTTKHMDPSHNINKDAHKMGKKNPGVGPSTSYTSRGYAYAGDRYEMSLFGSMLNKGINLDSVEVIEGEVPTKNTDPRLKEPNIPIFLFPNGQVYVKGCNDQEEYKEFVDKDGFQTPRAFKYLPMKFLKDNAEKFAYIDGSKDSNFIAGEKHKERINMKAEMPLDYYRDKARAGQTDWRGVQQYDKSGYRLIPSADKYREKLAELKASKIYDVLEEIHDYLTYVQEELAELFSNIDLTSGNFNEFDEIKDIFNYAVSNYTNVLERVDSITSSNVDEEEMKRHLMDVTSRDYNYKRLQNYIGELKEKTGKIFNSIIDWI